MCTVSFYGTFSCQNMKKNCTSFNGLHTAYYWHAYMILHASQAGFYIQPAILNINNYFIKSQSTIRMNDHIGCIRYCTSKLLGLTCYKYSKTGVHASVLAPPSHQHSKQHVCSGNQQLLWNKSNAQCSPSNGSRTKKLQLHSRLKQMTKSCSIS